MNQTRFDIVILGLSITSSWGNGHATTYRALLRGLHELGHRVLFLERNVPWYAEHRDMPDAVFGRACLYSDLPDLQRRFADVIGAADLVIVGSFVPEGAAVGEWVLDQACGLTAFYDIDTPITLSRLEHADGEPPYVTREQIGRYDLYLSFSGGPVLDRIADLGSPLVRPLYCSVDPEAYRPAVAVHAWDMGYMGTYSADRQPPLQRMLLDVGSNWSAGRFVVAGPQYPATCVWPANVTRIEHLPPHRHRWFYNRQRYTLNVTRERMIESGYSPSVRIFEAAACGVPIISDRWEGLDTFMRPGREILVADTASEVRAIICDLPGSERTAIAEAARQRVLREHTARRRAEDLVGYIREARGDPATALTMVRRETAARTGLPQS